MLHKGRVYSCGNILAFSLKHEFSMLLSWRVNFSVWVNYLFLLGKKKLRNRGYTQDNIFFIMIRCTKMNCRECVSVSVCTGACDREGIDQGSLTDIVQD